MMDFLATNFNLPTIIGAVIVFGGTGLIVWHSHKHGGVGCDCGGSCHGECGCSGCCNGSCKETAKADSQKRQTYSPSTISGRNQGICEKAA